MTEESQCNKDDSIEMAALYLCGALTADERELVEAELQAGNRELIDAIRRLEPCITVMWDQFHPIQPRPEIKQRLLKTIEYEESKMTKTSSQSDPVPLKDPIWRKWSDEKSGESLFTLRSDDSPWEPTGTPGVFVRRLFSDAASNRMTALFRMEPGSSYPQHVHGGAEECYVLEGDLHVGDDVLHPGDYQRAAEGSLHGIQSTEGGCLLLVTSSLSDEHI